MVYNVRLKQGPKHGCYVCEGGSEKEEIGGELRDTGTGPQLERKGKSLTLMLWGCWSTLVTWALKLRCRSRVMPKYSSRAQSAVSYTHLDVYKRQIKSCVLVISKCKEIIKFIIYAI